MGDNDEILSFEDIKGENEKEADKAESSEKELKDSDKKEDSKSEKDKETSEKKDDKSSDKKDDKKSEKKDDEKSEKKDDEKSEKKDDEKSEKKNDEKSEKKDDVKSEKKDDEKSEKKDDEKSDKKDDEKSEKKDEKKSSAVSQSKRLEEAKKDSEEKGVEVKKDDSKKDDTKKEDNKKEKPVKEKKERKPLGKKGVLTIVGVVCGLLLIAYIAGFVYFSNNFYSDVIVNGNNVSDMNKENAAAVLKNFYDGYKLDIKTIDDKDIILKGSDVETVITMNEDINSIIKKQQPELWFVKMWEHHEFNVDATAKYSKDRLNKFYGGLNIFDKKTMVMPKDAYVDVDKDGKFAIIPEVLGTTIKEDEAKAAIENALSHVSANLNLNDEGCYELPKVYSDSEDVVAEFEAKNEFNGYDVKIQMDDLTLEPKMELFDVILKKSGDSYEVSKDLVDKYVNILAKKYDTMNKPRLFHTSFDDRYVSVNGKAFGYELDKEKTSDAIYKAVTGLIAKGDKGTKTVDAEFISKGISLIGDNDIGDTYVEVNLSEQRVVAYKNGKKICEGDCVSGNEGAGHGTHIGLFRIQDKKSPTVLRGDMKTVTVTEQVEYMGEIVEVTHTESKPEYESPVTFWLQFNGGEGLHDARAWRSAYGGEIYKYSGSHGCVNLPYDLAEKLYKNFEVGDPVVIYFWDNENRK